MFEIDSAVHGRTLLYITVSLFDLVITHDDARL